MLLLYAACSILVKQTHTTLTHEKARLDTDNRCIIALSTRTYMEAMNTVLLNGLARALVHAHVLSESQARAYQHAAAIASTRFISYLVHNASFSAYTLAQAIATHFHLPYLDLDTLPQHDIETLDAMWRFSDPILPLYRRGSQWCVAMDDPTEHEMLNTWQVKVGCPLFLMIADTDKLHQRLQQAREQQEHQQLNALHIVPCQDVPLYDDSPILRFIQRLLSEAVSRGASDLHFEPYQGHYRIRSRQDGILYEISKPPQHLANRITNCIKIMANLNITERRLPQDGHFTLPNHPHVDARVSICPTMNGEKTVIRLLDTALTPPSIDSLDFTHQQKKQLQTALACPHGMLLATGPTGSGKTITLYALLHELNSEHVNILTVEDPVEIHVPGINQVSISPATGLDFATTLRSFLRQDPDVMMLGEIRDRETAEIALKAALTGHLVLSTLHSNGTVDTLTRLKNMGLSNEHLSSALRVIIAQRLVRRLCSHCKRPDKPSTTNNHTSPSSSTRYIAQGCQHCLQGYQGRLALFEILPLSTTFIDAMLSGENARTLHQRAVDEGMQTLFEHGLEKINQGLTTFDEVLRVSTPG